MTNARLIDYFRSADTIFNRSSAILIYNIMFPMIETIIKCHVAVINTLFRLV